MDDTIRAGFAIYALLDKDGFAAFIDAAMHTIDGLMDYLEI